jgi:hypothetical protein
MDDAFWVCGTLKYLQPKGYEIHLRSGSTPLGDLTKFDVVGSWLGAPNQRRGLGDMSIAADMLSPVGSLIRVIFAQVFGLCRGPDLRLRDPAGPH